MAPHLVRLLKAAADPTRLRLLNLLRLGRICVCDLQRVLDLSQPTVSRHLASLRNAGLVDCARDGTRMVYSLTPAASPEQRALLRLLEDCCPEEERHRADKEAFLRAVASGCCRLDPWKRFQDRHEGGEGNGDSVEG